VFEKEDDSYSWLLTCISRKVDNSEFKKGFLLCISHILNKELSEDELTIYSKLDRSEALRVLQSSLHNKRADHIKNIHNRSNEVRMKSDLEEKLIAENVCKRITYKMRSEMNFKAASAQTTGFKVFTKFKENKSFAVTIGSNYVSQVDGLIYKACKNKNVKSPSAVCFHNPAKGFKPSTSVSFSEFLEVGMEMKKPIVAYRSNIKESPLPVLKKKKKNIEDIEDEGPSRTAPVVVKEDPESDEPAPDDEIAPELDYDDISSDEEYESSNNSYDDMELDEDDDFDFGTARSKRNNIYVVDKDGKYSYRSLGYDKMISVVGSGFITASEINNIEMEYGGVLADKCPNQAVKRTRGPITICHNLQEFNFMVRLYPSCLVTTNFIDNGFVENTAVLVNSEELTWVNVVTNRRHTNHVRETLGKVYQIIPLKNVFYYNNKLIDRSSVDMRSDEFLFWAPQDEESLMGKMMIEAVEELTDNDPIKEDPRIRNVLSLARKLYNIDKGDRDTSNLTFLEYKKAVSDILGVSMTEDLKLEEKNSYLMAAVRTIMMQSKILREIALKEKESASSHAFPKEDRINLVPKTSRYYRTIPVCDRKIVQLAPVGFFERLAAGQVFLPQSDWDSLRSSASLIMGRKINDEANTLAYTVSKILNHCITYGKLDSDELENFRYLDELETPNTRFLNNLMKVALISCKSESSSDDVIVPKKTQGPRLVNDFQSTERR
jgi:hypothetical protein